MHKGIKRRICEPHGDDRHARQARIWEERAHGQGAETSGRGSGRPSRQNAFRWQKITFVWTDQAVFRHVSLHKREFGPYRRFCARINVDFRQDRGYRKTKRIQAAPSTSILTERALRTSPHAKKRRERAAHSTAKCADGTVPLQAKRHIERDEIAISFDVIFTRMHYIFRTDAFLELALELIKRNRRVVLP